MSYYTYFGLFLTTDRLCVCRYYGSGINIPEKLEGKRVLDIGCGSGSLVFILSKLVGPSGYVVGVDFCDGLVSK